MAENGIITNRVVVNSYESAVLVSGATYSCPVASSGGAAYVNSSGTLTGSSNTFSGNSAYYLGGAVYNGGTINFSGSNTFSRNSVSSNGGAVCNVGSGSNTFSGSNAFSGNSAYYCGGAVYNGSGTLLLSGSNAFSGNSASSGGAICNRYGTVTLSGSSTFSRNSAGYGGAIYNFSSGTLFLSGSNTFSCNSAISGGAICNCSSGTLFLSGSNTFSGNSACYGGAVYNSGSNTFINSSNFYGSNTFSDNSANTGGAIYNEFGTLTFSGSNAFIGNSATLSGGGAICNSGIINLSGSSVFSGNSARYGGGAVYNSSGTVTLSGSSVFFCNSAANGGAICNVRGIVAFKSDAAFIGNSATLSGGAIFNDCGMVSIKGAVTLATSYDTIVNSGTFSWDLTDGVYRHGKINNYQYYSNCGIQTITVTATQAAGDYVIATGDFSGSLLGKNNFTVTGGMGSGVTVTIGGGAVKYGSRIYSLAVSGTDLTLNVTKAPSTCVSNYNNTAMSDVLHVAADGSVFVMRDTAEGYKWSNVINNITGWKLGEARRDVTGDGLADVQITCDAGNMTYVAALRNDYLISGDVSLNYYLIGGYDNTQWNYIGSADVDGDGKSEVMMAQTEAGSSGGIRHVAAWVTNDAGQWVGNTWVGGLTGTWNVTGTADVDGNGTDNVILCRADGMIGYWSETGSNQIVEVWNAGGSTMLTSGNFAGNDTDGILWTNVYGDFFTWNNIATGLIGERIGNVSDLTGSWAFGGTGDYNGDGKDDILWRNTATGTLAYGGTTKETFANLVQIA